jgi:hypothetical protein
MEILQQVIARRKRLSILRWATFKIILFFQNYLVKFSGLELLEDRNNRRMKYGMQVYYAVTSRAT